MKHNLILLVIAVYAHGLRQDVYSIAVVPEIKENKEVSEVPHLNLAGILSDKRKTMSKSIAHPSEEREFKYFSEVPDLVNENFEDGFEDIVFRK